MRIWSIHPSYLDSKGLVALWREVLLAKKVLENKTQGYKNHPQLIRFKELQNPVNAINCYLSDIYSEAMKRKYNFDKNKINWQFNKTTIQVKSGQIQYEFEHLKRKLKLRDYSLFRKISAVEEVIPHPIFQIVEGGIEDWEVIN